MNKKSFVFFEWFIARRYLKSPQKKGFVSVIAGFSFLGISLGVATLIIVMSVMNGFRTELLGRIIGMKGHAVIYSQEGIITDDPALQSLIKKVPGVHDILPLVEKQGILFFQSQTQGVLIRGIDEMDLSRQSLIMKNLTPDSLPLFKEDAIFIGKRLADRFNVRLGDRVSLVTSQMQNTPFGALPKQRSFFVRGIFEVGMNEYDKSIVFIPLKKAQQIFALEGGLNVIEVFSEMPELVSELSFVLQETLGPSYQVLDWQHSDTHIFRAVQIERNVMFLILTLIILIASFNVISGLIMLVKDKTQDIAILRTMGASRGAILRIFFITGSSIGIVGTFLGVVLGLSFLCNIESIRHFLEHTFDTDLFQAEIYFLTHLPVKIDRHEITLISLMALVLSFLATLYPSFRAAKLNPSEGVRS